MKNQKRNLIIFQLLNLEQVLILKQPHLLISHFLLLVMYMEKQKMCDGWIRWWETATTERVIEIYVFAHLPLVNIREESKT